MGIGPQGNWRGGIAGERGVQVTPAGGKLLNPLTLLPEVLGQHHHRQHQQQHHHHQQHQSSILSHFWVNIAGGDENGNEQLQTVGTLSTVINVGIVAIVVVGM